LKNSASVGRPHFTNTFGQVFTTSCRAENMRLPEDGADVPRNA